MSEYCNFRAVNVVIHRVHNLTTYRDEDEGFWHEILRHTQITPLECTDDMYCIALYDISKERNILYNREDDDSEAINI